MSFATQLELNFDEIRGQFRELVPNTGKRYKDKFIRIERNIISPFSATALKPAAYSKFLTTLNLK